MDDGTSVLRFNNAINGNALNLPSAVNINYSIVGGVKVSGSDILATARSTGIAGNLTHVGTINMDIAGKDGVVEQIDFFNVTGTANLSGATLHVRSNFTLCAASAPARTQ